MPKSSTSFERPIVLGPAESRPRHGRHAAICALGVVWTLVAAIDWRLQLTLIAAILVTLGMQMGAGRRPPATALWLPGPGWLLEIDGERRPATIDPATRVFPSLVVLVLKAADRRRFRFEVHPKGAASGAHRRLRVRLLLGRG